jgi:DNA helicase HerA-like ATPase
LVPIKKCSILLIIDSGSLTLGALFMTINKLVENLKEGYRCEGSSITLGRALFDEEVIDAAIKIPLSTLNRHGLIARATGTGKTKTIQLLAENLSERGVPVLLMDLKGDLSGLAAEGVSNDHIEQRQSSIGIPFKPKFYPVEFLSLSSEKGIKLRATVSEFGPLLFSKFLELNDTQSGIVSLIFKYCDDHQLPLLDLKDFKKTLNFTLNEGKKEVKENYGAVSSRSAGTIMRKIMELEQQGGNEFFGEPSFEVEDLLGVNEDGLGTISVLRLSDLQGRPKIFSTFMLSLLAEIYEKFPEEGDLDKPKLVIFIDEAHLLFESASKTLLQQMETIVKLIRSKGVGIFFCTQNPDDVPEDVLSQLGMKIQHALRAFTAKDRKAIKLAAQNYSISEFYKTDELLTSLGIGEAVVTALDEKGRPTPLAATLLRAPASRMGPLTAGELDAIVEKSKLASHYNESVDRESAYEILNKKIEKAVAEPAEVKPKNPSKTRARSKKEEGVIDTLSKNKMVKNLGRTLVRELTRGLFGILSGRK